MSLEQEYLAKINEIKKNGGLAAEGLKIVEGQMERFDNQEKPKKLKELPFKCYNCGNSFKSSEYRVSGKDEDNVAMGCHGCGKIISYDLTPLEAKRIKEG